MAAEVEFVKSIPYFSGLGADELDSIGKLIFERMAKRGDMILLEGEPAEALYFVASGVVKVFKTSDEGKEQILNLMRPGESFNDVPVFDDGPNPASVQAIGPVLLYGIRKDDMEAILRRHPQIALNVTRVLSQRTRSLVSLIEDLSFRHVTSRVAKILLEHGGDGAGSRLRLTQQEMAAMAGTARETVGRSLKALEDEGMIRISRHRIAITDKEGLREMARVAD